MTRTKKAKLVSKQEFVAKLTISNSTMRVQLVLIPSNSKQLIKHNMIEEEMAPIGQGYRLQSQGWLTERSAV